MNNTQRMAAVFGLGLAAVAWVAWGFVGTSALALLMTAVIAAVYCWGARELWQFAQATDSLRTATQQAGAPVADLPAWLQLLHPTLRAPVRQRVEGERVALPSPGMTPYLVGLLVMLGMLGTFLGMVVTFKGAVFALEGSADLDAIRAALAAPIKGLGLSFGTSVAGVATSAMLGLLSSLCRRERLEAVRALDHCIATTLRGFSQAQQREDLFQALQVQALAMPQVVDRLQGLIDAVERRHEALGSQLQTQQQAFHTEASATYQQLAASVGTSLRDSLAASAQIAGDTIRPVVEQAMAELARESAAGHQRQQAAAQEQQQALSEQWRGTAQQVADTWTQALHTQQGTQQQLVQALDAALQRFATNFEARSAEVLAGWQAHATQSQATQAQGDQARLAAWNDSLQAMARSLAAEWQQLGAQAAQEQQRVAAQLQAAAEQVAQQVATQVQATVEGATALVAQSADLVRARSESEAKWMESHQAQTQALAQVWQQSLAELRGDEQQRGQAAVERLDALQAAVAQHLASLGAALEQPLTRLLQTASDVPRAAAEVIAQLRQEMTRLGERDNAALAERTAMLEQVATLLATVEQASGQQRQAIDALVQSATGVLEQASSRFAQALDAQSGKVDDVAAHVAASAIELSSLGETFGHGVAQFGASNEQLIASLQTVEGSIQQAMQRSDEQLAYYVAQAREVIDLSLSAQQSLVEDLRRLHAQASGVAA
ncbi:DUF802 domain-containing protein [Curvibacter sp. APW13]|uniref:DUF802 domain-containing protein n=1 Tax=Curvibacter sp. APW13 TaxID=3077236 RepID=UPI0028E045E2|nr:DUF802 domain-containing protein [Curvibacter sp. APW13]MDT8992521.1 DUF802 domain-containing protein [Curvibacter sp. APW13]